MLQVIEFDSFACFSSVLNDFFCVFLSVMRAELDAGKWGKWSEWSQCTSKFSWGTQIRYRFCDSPPPRYGGKFCEVSVAGNLIKYFL